LKKDPQINTVTKVLACSCQRVVPNSHKSHFFTKPSVGTSCHPDNGAVKGFRGAIQA